MLVMSGKLRGPFEIYYVEFTDAYGNGFSLPWCTAITLITSLLRLRPFVFILGHSMIDANVQIFQQMKTLHADWLCCKWLKESSYLLKPFYMEDSYH